MAIAFIKYIFGSSGDTTTVPNTVQPDGSVSIQEGYGPQYAFDPANPNVRYPERDKLNFILNIITAVANQYQVQGFPDFITTSANGGTPFPYDVNAYVRYSGNVYFSLVTANTALPTDATKWQLVGYPSPFKTGDVKENIGTTLESGWLWANGQTVGNAASNATGRANPDTEALFTKIWTEIPSAASPIYTSAGVLSTRGASAAADYAANKAITILNKCGRVSAGLTTMGGVTAPAGLLTGDTATGVNGAVIGATGGAQSHSLTSQQNGLHTHVVEQSLVYDFSTGSTSRFALLPKTAGYVDSNTISDASGNGDVHNNVQPTVITSFMIKL